MNKLLRYLIPICFGLLTLIQMGCKEKHIPKKDMVSILSEVFITDAITNTSNLTLKLSRKDSIEYYKPIIEKYGYTEDVFVKTVNYYMDNPRELEELLDKVVGQLSIIETVKSQALSREIEKEEEIENQEGNLWTNKKSWKLPEDGGNERLYFKVPTQGAGLYSVSADVIVKPEDESLSPSMHVWFYTEEEPPDYRFSPKQEEYLKDGEKRTVILRCMLTDTTMTHFVGYIIDNQPQTGRWLKHAEISKISIRFTPMPEKIISPSLNKGKKDLNMGKLKPVDRIKKNKSMELFNKEVEVEQR
ncbi:MAG: DUF4296 domain-containing protein [Bacteroidales bacterium]|nr:DUF4296 domain-containing protein [Bacteroidales bacterium]MDD4383917.1 DUF4296 domain-containing protein [Bacteroidales bacterium]